MSLERTDYLDRARPPESKRTVEYPSPNVSNLVVVESVPISSETYKPLPYRSPHPTYSSTGLILVKQRQVKAANNQVWAIRIYASRDINEDWFDYTLRYAGDVVANPIFIRTYHKLRDEFAPQTHGTPFQGVYRMVVTAGGSNYTSAPTVVFTGANTRVAAANAIMSPADGSGLMSVIGLELTDEGDGYAVAPTISFSGGGGAAAAATAYIQPAAAVLVKEELVELDNESPDLASLFVKVTRVFETLPGPLFIWNSYDDEKAGGQRNRGAVKKTSQSILAVGNEAAVFDRPSPGKARKTYYEPRGESAIVLTKFVETWTEILINDQEVTSEFGGGMLDVTETRDEPGAQTPDEGLGVTSSRTETVSPDEQIKKSLELRQKTDPDLRLDAGGAGYTSNPTLVFTGASGGGGPGAGTARIGFKLATIAVDAGGGGYLVAPIVQIDSVDGNGYGVRAVANMTGGAVASVTVLDPGNDFTAPPTITFVARGSGAGATAHSTLETTGSVNALVLTTPGDYTVAPALSFTGGAGAGAAASYLLPSVEWPELIGCETDPKYGIVVDISKKVVPARTKFPGVPVSLVSPYVDIAPHDRWRSIQIVSKIDLRSLPKPIEWGTVHHLDLPSTLLDVTASWDKIGGESASAQLRKVLLRTPTGIHGTVQVTAAGGTTVLEVADNAGYVAFVEVQVNNGVLGAIEILFNHGYRGPAQAIVSREFFFGPPTLAQIAAITKIIPVTGSASLIGKHTSFHKSLGTGPLIGLGTAGSLQTKAMTFGPFLSGSVVSNSSTFSANSSTADAQAGPDLENNSYEATFVLPGTQGTLNVNIPVSDPVSLPSGTWICVDSTVVEWRFNLFVLYTTFARIP